MTLLERDQSAAPLLGARLLHTMLRVRDLDASLSFYVDLLGMRLQRLQRFEEGRFTLAFVGYGPEEGSTVLELTHNWDGREYELGSAYGHMAIGVADVHSTTAALARAGARVLREAGPLAGDPNEVIAFIEDPDGYRVELIEKSQAWQVGLS